jgi:hypothetical protein
MFVHLAIHRPRPGKAEELIGSMHRLDEALKGQPGLREVHTLREEHGTVLVGLSIWDSRESWLEARPVMMDAAQDDDPDVLEVAIPEVYHLEEA